MENQNKNSDKDNETVNESKSQKLNINNKIIVGIMNKIGAIGAKIPLTAWIIIGIAASAFMIWDSLTSGGLCYAKRYFGIACPSCGMTRATKSVLHLDFKAAFYYHPFFWDVPLIVGTGFLSIVDKNKKRSKIFLRICILLFIAYLICWIVRLITGTTV